MGRIIKSGKTKLEKLIRTVWNETHHGTVICNNTQQSVIAAIYKTLSYFEMDDYLHNKDNKNIFEKIYLSSKGKETQVKLAHELSLGVNTIIRYCNLFIKAFEKNLNDD